MKNNKFKFGRTIKDLLKENKEKEAGISSSKRNRHEKISDF